MRVTSRRLASRTAPCCSTAAVRVIARPRHAKLSHAGRTRRDVRCPIGFDFGDTEPEIAGKAAPSPTKLSTLGTLASSLLVLGSVLKGAVGEAFLAALAVTGKYQATNKEVMAAYGKFYALLLQSGSDSWEDYLMDQILLGRDNALARAVAQGNLEDGAPLLKALEYDLDVLQQLAVPLTRLAEYVGDTAPLAGPYWVTAASSASTKKPSKQTVGRLPPSKGSPQPALNLNMPSAYIQRPPTPEELKAWGASISNKQDWSEAAAVLRQYYHLHGFGITSRNTALRWSKGAFEEGSEGQPSLSPLSVLSPQREALATNTNRFCEGLPAQHCLVAGPSGSGKSWLLWESTLLAGKEKGVRIVEVPAAEQGSLLEAARGAGRYPRVRFILVADNVDLPARGGLATDLLAGLTGGAGPSGWPANTLLYVGASPSSTIKASDPVVSRFGLVLTTGELSEAEFRTTLTELAGGKQDLPDGFVAEAALWARARGGLTIRNAWMSLSALG